MDVVYITAILVFFGLTLALLSGCKKLGEAQ